MLGFHALLLAPPSLEIHSMLPPNYLHVYCFQIWTNDPRLFTTNHWLQGVVSGSGAVAQDAVRQFQQATRRPALSGTILTRTLNQATLHSTCTYYNLFVAASLISRSVSQHRTRCQYFINRTHEFFIASSQHQYFGH